MKCLVAGGSGFIGSHLVDALLAQGHEVVVLDNWIMGRSSNLAHLAGHPWLTVHEADVAEPLPAAAIEGQFAAIYHLASPASPVSYRRFPIETLWTNSVGTRNLLEVARRDSARFLLASTSEAYGEPLVHPQPEEYWGNVNPIGWRSCYDEGKRFAESLTVNYVRLHRVDARIARIFNTYGPRLAIGDGRVIANFCVQALTGTDLTIYGDGTQTRSLCYVDDLVRGLIALMDTPGIAGEVVNLGNPTEITVLEMAEIIGRLAGTTSRVVHRPLPEDDPTRRRPDITKAQRLLGWSPEIGLDEGMQRTLAYFQDEIARTAGAAAVPGYCSPAGAIASSPDGWDQ